MAVYDHDAELRIVDSGNVSSIYNYFTWSMSIQFCNTKVISMKSTIPALAGLLLLPAAGVINADTVKAPKGWNDSTITDTRVVSNGNATVTIGPWISLQGLSTEQWLSVRSNAQPVDGTLLSSELPKSESVPGAFSVTRKARFGAQEGYSILYLCPGKQGHARLLSLDVRNGGFGDTLKGAMFGEKVCKKEPKGSVDAPAGDMAAVRPAEEVKDLFKSAESGLSPSAELPQISDKELRAKNQRIPDVNRPKGASMYTDSYWSGFPAMLMQRVGMVLEFKGGYELACSDWDPTDALEAADLIHDEDCEVPGERLQEKIMGFTAGYRLDLSLGNISAYGIDGSEGSASSVSGSGLIFSSDGEVVIDQWHVSYMSSSAASARATTTNKGGITGRYYLDGNTITIVTSDGDTVNGFIGYSVDDGNKIDAVFVNGKHYWDRSK